MPPGTVVSGADGHFVEVAAQQRIPISAAAPLGSPVWVGVRPEHLKLDTGRGEGVPFAKARVRSIVSDGAISTVCVDWAGHELRTHLLAGRGIARTLADGDPVLLSVRPEEVHLMPRVEG